MLTVDRHGTFGFLEEGDTTFNYMLATINLDTMVFDLQFGSVDLANEIVPVVPGLLSFGLPPVTRVSFDTSGGPGQMLWLFQNNPAGQQVSEVTIGDSGS